MPLCTVTLLSLHTTTPNPLLTFLSTLHKSKVDPLILSRVLRWIILPTQTSTSSLLAQNIHWDLLLILPSAIPLPPQVRTLIQHQWTIKAGIPSSLLKNFSAKNKELLYPATGPNLANTNANGNGGADLADSSQNLQLSPSLRSWIETFSTSGDPQGVGAVSMLNLLAFKPGMKESYLKYGAAFAESVGSRHGGFAKIVGTVVGGEKEDGQGDGDFGGWDEVALAHYPSISHFGDMLGSADYQEVNSKYRVPALRDTFILCTSEIGVGTVRDGVGDGGPKL